MDIRKDQERPAHLAATVPRSRSFNIVILFNRKTIGTLKAQPTNRGLMEV